MPEDSEWFANPPASEPGGHPPQSRNLEIGRLQGKVRLNDCNPLTLMQKTTDVPDTRSYAPVAIPVDQWPDGVHLSYDTMAGFLAPYDNLAALAVARELDA
jgi:hypothetical protein